MYIRKEIREFIKKMPKDMKMPSHWRKFVNCCSEKYDLIIKHGNEYECTNCGKVFYSDKRVKQEEFCPFCNNRYLIRNSNLKWHDWIFYLSLIDNVENRLIIRYFEVYRSYNYKRRKFENSVVEFARIVPEFNIQLVNNRYRKIYWTEVIYHTKRIEKWRVFTGDCEVAQYYKKIYLDNIADKTKGTKYQYAPIKEALEYLKDERVILSHILEMAQYESFELLIKAGLYKLAITCPQKFEQKGSFEKRFGISKDYYDFMKKYDISEEELEVLKLIKKKDMRLITKLLKVSNDNIKELKKVSKYTSLIKLGEYIKGKRGFSIYNYIDYLRNMEKMDVPLTKKILFPENFNEAHDESVRKVKVVENKGTDKKMKQRYMELQKNEYSNNLYMIRPAKDLKDMKDEAKQQENCVYKNYSESYAFGDTDIYFMRDINNPNKSLVTVEVSQNKIRQKYQKKNKYVTEDQDKFLKEWENEVLKVA